jgi:hypothetical protein
LSKVIRDLVTRLDQKVDERSIGDPYLAPENYRVFPLSKDRFHLISNEDGERTLAFVDGGNQELIGAPNFSVQLNRIYFNLFKGNKRIIQDSIPHAIAFYSATFSRLHEESIYYDTTLFPIQQDWSGYLPSEADLSFNSMDRAVMIGNQRADIQRMGSIARRFAEWNYARFIAEEALNKDDILVTDGTLQTAFKNEDSYFQKLEEASVNRGVILAGLAKTSALFTSTGLSLIGSISRLAEDSELGNCKWGYYPIADGLDSEHGVRISAVRLHEHSNHVFRFELSKKQVDKMNEDDMSGILASLATNSRDLSFPGYPYGLVEADASARVTSEEAQTQRVLLLSEISRREMWDKVSRHMSASNAHDVLDFLKAGVVAI